MRGKRWWLLLPLVCVLAIATAIALLPQEDGEQARRGPGGRDLPASSAGGSKGPPAARSTRALPAEVSGTARVLGRVVDGEGRPVDGALVTANGPRRFEGAASADGRFTLQGLSPGEYLLFARQGALASEPLGPIPLGPGEELREVRLVLARGAVLAGTVRDARDGAPVPMASVAAGSSAEKADRHGRFRLDGLPAGTVRLTARAEGYVAREADAELAPGQERSGFEIHLERGARVSGRVHVGSEPVTGARVFAALYRFGARQLELLPIASAGVDGRFAGVVPPGRLQLVAQAAGLAEGRSSELELAAGEERQVDLALDAGGALSGSVRDADGKPVPSCAVIAFDPAQGRILEEELSGTDGAYWLAPLPPATYLLAASCTQGHAERSGLRLEAGAHLTADLRLGAGAIAGQVVDADGRPVAGAAIAVREEGSAAPELPVGAADAQGRFEVRGLRGARARVTATGPQGRAERDGVPTGTRDLLLQIAPSVLRGRVEGERGEPVADFVVWARPSSPAEGTARSKHFLEPTGEFELALAPSRYELRVGAPGHAPASLTGIEVPGNGAPVRVVLLRASTIRGRTVDAKGAPLAGVRVATDQSALWAFARSVPVPAGVSTVSDERGTFVLVGAAPKRRILLFAQKDGYEQRRVVPVEVPIGGEASEVTVQLQPAERNDEEPEFAGIGMSLTVKDGRVLVLETFEGGPANEAGLRSGDQVLAIDGAPTAGVSLGDAVSRIRGIVGTTVQLRVRRDGAEFSVAVPRAALKR